MGISYRDLEPRQGEATPRPFGAPLNEFGVIEGRFRVDKIRYVFLEPEEWEPTQTHRQLLGH